MLGDRLNCEHEAILVREHRVTLVQLVLRRQLGVQKATHGVSVQVTPRDAFSSMKDSRALQSFVRVLQSHPVLFDLPVALPLVFQRVLSLLERFGGRHKEAPSSGHIALVRKALTHERRVEIV